MIPSNIRNRHVEEALDAIDREGIPDGRDSRRFTLHARGRGRGYPPKYVLSVANQVANGLVGAADAHERNRARCPRALP